MVDLELTFTGPVTIGATAADLAAINAKLDLLISDQEKTMTELDNVETAEAALDTEVTALEAEQSTFLADVQAALAAAGSDPAALQAVADKLNAEAARLSALQSAQVAADPGAPAA